MREGTMRTCVCACMVVVVLMPASGLQRTAGSKTEPITVDLKTFKFKVDDKFADLFGYNEGEGKLFFYTNGPAEATVKVPADGTYDIVVRASCDSALNERAKFKLSLDGKLVGKENLLTADDAKDYTLSAAIKAGEHKLVIEFTNDAYK